MSKHSDIETPQVEIEPTHDDGTRPAGATVADAGPEQAPEAEGTGKKGAQDAKEKEKEKENEKKWGKPLWAAGWVAVPSILIEKQAALGLTATDLNIIMYLSVRWWKKDRLPFPSQQTIAKATGLGVRTINRRLKAMEAAGFITVARRSRADGGYDSNEYSLDGLIMAAMPYAIEKNRANSDTTSRSHKREATQAGKRMSKRRAKELADVKESPDD